MSVTRFISTGEGWLSGVVTGSAQVYPFDSDPALGSINATLVIL